MSAEVQRRRLEKSKDWKKNFQAKQTFLTKNNLFNIIKSLEII